MFVIEPHYTRLAAGAENRPSLQIPMVYEQLPEEPARWEYHVLTIDTREQALPDAEQLNALGREGWIMSGLLDERTNASGKQVHYYFVRRVRE